MTKFHTNEIEAGDAQETANIQHFKSSREFFDDVLSSNNLKINGIVHDVFKFEQFLERRFGDEDVGYKKKKLVLPADGEEYTVFEVDRTFYDNVLENRNYHDLGSFRVYQLQDNEDTTTRSLQAELDLEEMNHAISRLRFGNA